MTHTIAGPPSLLTLAILSLSCLLTSAQAQSCRNHRNESVDWFVTLHMPNLTAPGYLYYDSTLSAFALYAVGPDSPGHPLSNTFQALSNRSDLEIIAWNDQKPNGSQSSSLAHSKTLAIYSGESREGVFVVHSMPKYPDVQGKAINFTIDSSQKIYGQHLLCMTVGGALMTDFLRKTSTIRPYIYANTHGDNFTIPAVDVFEYAESSVGRTKLQAIFKNGYKNASIFEDGLALMLASQVTAETWGRPLMDPYCSDPFHVGNAGGVKVADGVEWRQTQDHSKWAVSSEEGSQWVCFGDMNRMESQFKRGGAFYCLQDRGLKGEMTRIVRDASSCPLGPNLRTE